MFENMAASQRLLVLANGFFEWKKTVEEGSRVGTRGIANLGPFRRRTFREGKWRCFIHSYSRLVHFIPDLATALPLHWNGFLLDKTIPNQGLTESPI
jgi:hypothetical protein